MSLSPSCMMEAPNSSSNRAKGIATEAAERAADAAAAAAAASIAAAAASIAAAAAPIAAAAAVERVFLSLLLPGVSSCPCSISLTDSKQISMYIHRTLYNNNKSTHMSL